MDTTVIDEFITFYQRIKDGLQQDADGNYFYQHNNKQFYCDMTVVEHKLAKNKFQCCMFGLWVKVNNRRFPDWCSFSAITKLTKLPMVIVQDVFFDYPLSNAKDFMFNLELAIQKLNAYKLDVK